MIFYKSVRNISKLMNIFALHLQKNGNITVYSITTIFSCAENKLQFVSAGETNGNLYMIKEQTKIVGNLTVLSIFSIFSIFSFQKK